MKTEIDALLMKVLKKRDSQTKLSLWFKWNNKVIWLRSVKKALGI